MATGKNASGQLEFKLGIDASDMQRGGKQVTRSLEEVQGALRDSNIRLKELQAQLASASASAAQAGQKINKAFSGELRGAIAGARAEVAKLNVEMAKVQGTDIAGADAGSRFSGLKGSITSLLSPTTALIGLLGGMTAGLVSVANASGAMQNQLKLVTQTEEDRLKVSTELQKISIETSANLLETTKLYAALARSTESIGANQTQLLAVTKAFNQAVSITGGSSASAAAAITQFNQAMASGVLRGEEFNSINEQAPRLMEALAKGLGVARGELKGLAEEGKLTSDIVLKAILDQSIAINDEFGKMDKTVGQAFDSFTGALGQATASTSLFQEVVTAVRNLLLDLSAIFQALSGQTAQVAGETNNLKDVFAGLGKFLSDFIAVATVLFLEFKFVISTVANDVVAAGRAVASVVKGEFAQAAKFMSDASESAKRARAELDTNTKAILRAGELRRIAESGVGQDEAFVKRATRQALTSGIKTVPQKQKEKKSKEKELAANLFGDVETQSKRDIQAIQKAFDEFKSLYDRNLVSLTDYYTEAENLVKRQQEVEQKAFDERKALLEAEAKNPALSDKERKKAQQELEKASQSNIDSQYKLGLQLVKIEQDRVAALEKYKAGVQEINLALMDRQGLGDSEESQLIRMEQIASKYAAQMNQALLMGDQVAVQAIARMTQLQQSAANIAAIASRLPSQLAGNQVSQASVQMQQQTGQITDLQAQKQLNALKQEEINLRIQNAQAQLAEAQTNNDTQKVIEIQQQIQLLGIQIEGLKPRLIDLGVVAQNTFSSGFENALNAIVLRTKSAGDAFKDLGRTILSSLANAAIKNALSSIGGALGGTGGFGGFVGSLLGFANGGVVPKVAGANNSPRGDGVLARLSPGEVVINNRAASLLGRGTLDALNSVRTASDLARSMKFSPPSVSRPSTTNRLADGGIVGPVNAQAGPSRIEVVNKGGEKVSTGAEFDIKNNVTRIFLDDLRRGGDMSKAVRAIR